MRIGILWAGFVLALTALAENGSPNRGKDLFERRCGGCHTLNGNKEGPKLRGVYGRKAAGVAGFGYSDALKKLNVLWNAGSLERWLSDPDAMAPGSDMDFRLTDRQERDAVILYLKSLR